MSSVITPQNNIYLRLFDNLPLPTLLPAGVWCASTQPNGADGKNPGEEQEETPQDRWKHQEEIVRTGFQHLQWFFQCLWALLTQCRYTAVFNTHTHTHAVTSCKQRHQVLAGQLISRFSFQMQPSVLWINIFLSSRHNRWIETERLFAIHHFHDPLHQLKILLAAAYTLCQAYTTSGHWGVLNTGK